MPRTENSSVAPARVNPFSTGDVVNILRERGWLASNPTHEQLAWCEHAAAILGGHAADQGALADLLALIFHYDAAEILARVETHVVLSRFDARGVVRQLALLLLEAPPPLNSEQFQEIVTKLKADLDVRGRELFHPIRLALAGRAGEGELDRVILLLDEAAPLLLAARVKSTRERIVEFCAALD